MQYRALSLAAFAAVVMAQDPPALGDALANTPELSSLAGFVEQAGLLETLAAASNVTILAPSNDAFTAFQNTSQAGGLATDGGLLSAILQYHVLNGAINSSQITETRQFVPSLLTNTSYTNVTGGQVVGAFTQDGNVTFLSGLGSTSGVTTADVAVANNVIVHIIDSVLTLPQSISQTAAASGLSGIVGALITANLVETVDTAEDVTVFAPNNAAFEAIGSALGNISVEALTSVLTYHVVGEDVEYSSDLTDDEDLTSLESSTLNINIEGSTPFVNGAAVVLADVLVANGVVHVIDNVLNPDNEDVEPSQGATAGAPAFSGASSASLGFTSNLPAPTVTPTAGAGAGQSGAGGAASTQPSGGFAPKVTGAAGAAALFGAGAAFLMV